MTLDDNGLDYDEFGFPTCPKCDARMTAPTSAKWEHHSSVQAECPDCGAVLVKSEVIQGSALFRRTDETVVDVDENGMALDPATKDPMNLPTGKSPRKDGRRGPWNISTREKPGTGLSPNDIRKMNSLPAVPGVVEKKPFEGCSEQQLGEIAVALELLLEHPETHEYVTKLQDALRTAMLNQQMEVGA